MRAANDNFIPLRSAIRMAPNGTSRRGCSNLWESVLSGLGGLLFGSRTGNPSRATSAPIMPGARGLFNDDPFFLEWAEECEGLTPGEIRFEFKRMHRRRAL